MGGWETLCWTVAEWKTVRYVGPEDSLFHTLVLTLSGDDILSRLLNYWDPRGNGCPFLFQVPICERGKQELSVKTPRDSKDVLTRGKQFRYRFRW